VLEAVQRRLDENPQAMRQRRETVEHPFGTLKMRMGATHFLMKRLPKVATRLVPSAVEECSGNPIAGACSVEMSFLSANHDLFHTAWAIVAGEV